MAPRGKIVRSTAAQISRLVDYMSTNANFACGEFSGPLGAQRLEAEWVQVKTLLAEHGPDKSVEQWKHTWRDLKKKAREEAGRARLARNKTANAVPVPELSENCQKILRTIGEEFAKGIGVEQETGIGVGSIDAPTSTQASAEADAEQRLDIQFQPVDAEIEFLEAAEVPEVSRRPRCRDPHPPGGSAGPSGAARAARRRTGTATQQYSAAFVRAQIQSNRILQPVKDAVIICNTPRYDPLRTEYEAPANHAKQTTIEVSRELPSKTPVTRKRKHNQRDDNSSGNKQVGTSFQDDDLTAFGNYVVSTLRKLSTRNCVAAQDEIFAVLSRYKLQQLENTEATFSGTPLTPTELTAKSESSCSLDESDGW